MRGLRVSVVAGLTAVSMTAAGCGVAAPRNVASVDGVGVSMDDIKATARDPLSQLVTSDAPDYELPGDAARQALMFEVTRAAWIAEAERWGLDPATARDAAEKDLDQRLASSGENMKLSEHMRQAYVDSTAARMVLEQRFEQLNPQDESDLRKIYEMSPALWDRTCAFILLTPPKAETTVLRLARKGTSFEQIAKKVKGAEVVATPKQGCLSRSSIPEELKDGISGLALDTPKVFDVEFNGSTDRYLIQVESREHLSFEKAKGDLEQIASALKTNGPQAWISTRLTEARIDPRFASGVTIGGNGQASLLPPEGPVQPRIDAQAPAEMGGAGAGGSQSNASQPNASQSNASQPNASQPNTSQPNTSQPNASQTNDSQAGGGPNS